MSYARAWWWVKDSNLRRLSHQIYSLAPLAARETHRVLNTPGAAARGGRSRSQRRESNSQPSAYKAEALPLSYAGEKTNSLPQQNTKVNTKTAKSAANAPCRLPPAALPSRLLLRCRLFSRRWYNRLWCAWLILPPAQQLGPKADFPSQVFLL